MRTTKLQKVQQEIKKKSFAGLTTVSYAVSAIKKHYTKNTKKVNDPGMYYAINIDGISFVVSVSKVDKLIQKIEKLGKNYIVSKEPKQYSQVKGDFIISAIK